MGTSSLLIIALVPAAAAAIFVVAWVARVLLPEDSSLHGYVSNKAIKKYMAWVFANPSRATGLALLLIFTVLTLAYS